MSRRARAAAWAAVGGILLAGLWIASDDARLRPDAAPRGPAESLRADAAAHRRDRADRPAAAAVPGPDATVGAEAPPAPVDLDAVDRERDLHGVVVRRDGSPAAGAELRVVRHAGRDVSLDVAGHRRETPGPATHAASDGTFRIALAPDESVSLDVRAADAVPVRFHDLTAGARVRLVLSGGVRLRLRVTAPDGAPAPAVDLEVGASSAEFGARTVRVTTDALGVAVAEGLPPGGTASVVCRTPAAGRTRWWDLAVPVEGEGEHELRLLPCRTLRGRVTDAATGAAVPGARVGMGWVQEAAVETAADGTYELPGWTGHGYDEIDATARGLARAAALVGSAEVLDFALRPGFAVRGRALGADGAPLPGARVAAVASVRHADRRQRISIGHATTGADGRFLVADLADDLAHGVTVFAEGYARTRVGVPAPGGGRAEVDVGDVVLGPPRTLAGRVLDDAGRPVAGAYVDLRGPTTPAGDLLAGNDYGLSADRRTDDLGRWRLTDVPPGTYHAYVWMPGVDAVEADFDLRADRDLLDAEVRLAAARQVAVRVVDEDGTPVRGVEVVVDGEGPDRLPLFARPDASGTARFRVPDGFDRVSLCFDGPVEFLFPDDVPLAPGATELTVVLRRGIFLSGFVRDPEGRPVTGAMVSVRAGEYGVSDRTGTDGGFRVRVPAGPRCDLAFHGDVGGRESGLSARADAVSPGTDVVLRCERIATDRTLTVRVRDADGRAAPGVALVARPTAGAPVGEAVSGDDGVATFRNLPARTLWICAARGDVDLADTPELVPAGQTVDVELEPR